MKHIANGQMWLNGQQIQSTLGDFNYSE